MTKGHFHGQLNRRMVGKDMASQHEDEEILLGDLSDDVEVRMTMKTYRSLKVADYQLKLERKKNAQVLENLKIVEDKHVQEHHKYMQDLLRATGTVERHDVLIHELREEIGRLRVEAERVETTERDSILAYLHGQVEEVSNGEVRFNDGFDDPENHF